MGANMQASPNTPHKAETSKSEEPGFLENQNHKTNNKNVKLPSGRAARKVVICPHRMHLNASRISRRDLRRLERFRFGWWGWEVQGAKAANV